MTERMTYDEAKKRVREMRDFYWHLASYVIINAFLVALNWWTSPGHWWVFWPIVGWGFGLAFHAASVFIEGGPWGQAWERRKIQELMGEDEPDQTPRGPEAHRD